LVILSDGPAINTPSHTHTPADWTATANVTAQEATDDANITTFWLKIKGFCNQEEAVKIGFLISLDLSPVNGNKRSVLTIKINLATRVPASLDFLRNLVAAASSLIHFPANYDFSNCQMEMEMGMGKV